MIARRIIITPQRFRLRPLLLLLGIVSGLMTTNAQINDLPRTSPEAVGLKSEQVMAFFDSLLAHPNTEIHSVMVMRHGKVVGEMYPKPFNAEYKHTQFSCSKTFVAAAVGIAISEKRLRLDDRLVTFFPQQLPKVVSWNLASITVEDLLTMRSGFVVDTKMRERSRQWIRDYLAHPMNGRPGKLFQYDSIDTYLLSAIVQQVTGMTVLEYLRQRVFSYMNIRDVMWELSPEGIVTGGWGLYVQPESLAKFGQLLLQRGQWHGRQLIPASWVDAMTSAQVHNEGDDYGYQMWMCNYPTAVRAAGAYGQYIVVVPKQDVVVVINQCTLSGAAVQLKHIWQTLFAGMSKQPLSPSDYYQQLLSANYQLPLVEGELTSKVLSDYQGKTIRLEKNPLGWQSLMFIADDMIELTDTAGLKGTIMLGHNEWATSVVRLRPLNARYHVQRQFSGIQRTFRVGACYGWKDEQLSMKLHFVDWMGSVFMIFRFEGDVVRIEAKENYQSRPITLLGHVDTTIP